MYIGNVKFDLKNLSKNQRKELRELKRLYEDAVAAGTTPPNLIGEYSREDSRGIVTKKQLDKLAKSSYKDIYKTLKSVRDKLNERGLGRKEDYELPHYESPLKDNPNLQIEAGGKVHDLEKGKYYNSLREYQLEQQLKEQQAFEKAMRDIEYKESIGQNVKFPPDKPKVDEEIVSGDVVKVDNFLNAVKPTYTSKFTKGTQSASELYEALYRMTGEYGYEATAKLIDSLPNDLVTKIQSGNSADRYSAIGTCLEYVYTYLFDEGYMSTAEEWDE